MNFSIGLVGDAKVGKTTWIKRITTGEFQKEHKIVNEKHQVSFNTNKGRVTFNVVELRPEDVTSDEWIPENLIYMFDVSNEESFNGFARVFWEPDDFHDYLAIVANKVESKKNRIVMPAVINHQLKELNRLGATNICGSEYFEISAKSNFQFEKPWLHAARVLAEDPDLVFVPEVAVEPPECVMDLAFHVEQIPRANL